MSPDLKLYHYPLRACSHVTVCALEEARLSYDDVAVDIRKPDRSAEHLRVHPEGKVPALLVDNTPITENAAILVYLHSLAPHAALFPTTNDPFIHATHIADLVWISSTLHPAIRQVRMPMRFTDGDPSGVQNKGIEFATQFLERIERRLIGQPWWYGANWSIVDVYISWAITTGASSGSLPMERFPKIKSHLERVRSRSSFERAITRQRLSQEKFGIEFPDEWKTI
ncbi:MAG: glutathione S-transferase family protein [Pseudomonadota bacterium]